MQKVKKVIMGLLIAIVGVIGVTAPVSADSKKTEEAKGSYTCPPGSLNETAKSPVECNVKKDEDGKGLFPTINNVINVILAIVGIVTVIMIILGGISYITSQGDPQKTKRGRDTILYGIIGLVITLLAWAIVNFVISSFFNDSETKKESMIINEQVGSAKNI